MLDLRRLRYLLAVEKCGSISAASRELRIAQPAISYHISELERLVGFALLERQPRGVRATDRGKVLLQHARVIITKVEEAERAVQGLAAAGAHQRTIKLSMIPSWATTFTPAIVAAVADRFSSTFLHIFEARTEESIRMIGAHEVDLAVTLEGGEDHEDELVVNESLFAVSAKKRAKSVTFAELSKIDLILPSKSNPLRKVIDRSAEEAGVSLRIALEIDGQDTVKRAVEAGIGDSILAWNAVRQECVKGTIWASQIIDPTPHRSVFLRKSSTTTRETAAIFRNILREIVTSPVEVPSA
jgi:LysR family nitrogen assimilation transcriptional regulator